MVILNDLNSVEYLIYKNFHISMMYENKIEIIIIFINSYINKVIILQYGNIRGIR